MRFRTNWQSILFNIWGACYIIQKKIVWRGVDEDEVAVLPVQITKQIFVYTYVWVSVISNLVSSCPLKIHLGLNHLLSSIRQDAKPY